MKNILIIILIGVSVTAYTQLPVAFETYRHIVQDTVKWGKINKLVAKNNFEKVKDETYQYAKFCLKENNLQEFLFVLNQTSANINIIGKDLSSALEMLKYAEKNVIDTKDTLSVEYAILMKFIATTYFYQYDDENALRYFYRGYKIVKQLKNIPALDIDLTLSVGNSYVNLGEYKNAIPYLDTVLNQSIKYKYAVPFMLASQGFGYIASREDVFLALKFFLKIEKVAKEINIEENHYNKYLAHICNSMVAMYTESRQNEKSKEYSKKALQYFQKTNVQDVYLGSAILSRYFAESSPSLTLEASDLLKDSILTYIKNNKVNNLPVSIPLYSSIIENYYQKGLLDSLEVYKSKVESIIASSPQKDFDMAMYYKLIANLITDNHEKIVCLDQAVSFLTNDSVLKGSEFRVSHFKQVVEKDFYTLLKDIFLAYSHISKRYFEKDKNIDDLIESINFLKLTLEGYEFFAGNTSNKSTGLLHSEEIYTTANMLIDNLREAYLLTKDSIYLNDIFELDSKTKAFFVYYSYGRLTGRQSKDHSVLVKQVMKHNRLETELRAARLKKNETLVNSLSDSIIDVNFDIVRKQILRDSDQESQFSVDIDLEDVQANLDHESVMMSYFVSDHYFYTTIISKNNIELVSTPFSKSFSRNIKKALRSMKSGEDITTELNNELYKMLFNKLEKYQNKSHLIMIPHQFLSGFPFEVLKDKSNTFLVEKYSFSYHYSVPMWLTSAKKEKKRLNNIDFFAPVFKDGKTKEIARNLEKYNYFEKLYLKDRSSLNSLEHSEIELNSIASICEKQGVSYHKYLFKDANEYNFKHKIKHSDILHISTHGYFNKRQAELSGLFLWPLGKEDGYLFSNEILSLDLNADLVVLSSCNSGSGVLEGSEGQNSMQRKFIIKRVPNVMASLWKVHDEKTKDLMIAFYKHLLEGGETYDIALQLAKKDCIKQGLLPLDWAGFILIGE